MTDELYAKLYKLAFGKAPTAWQVDRHMNLGLVVERAKENKSYQNDKELQKVIDSQIHKGLTSPHRDGPDVEADLRKQYQLVRGEAVMTNPATGETFRGSPSRVREEFAESCVRSGLTDSKSKIDWEN